MPSAKVKVHVRIDQKALARETKAANGTTGRVIASFAGLVTKEINDTISEHAGGPWWRVKSTIFDAKAFGASATVIVRRSKPHVIVARHAEALSFAFPDGERFYGLRVNHPGSTPPEHLVRMGIDRAIAKKEFKFLSLAPVKK